MDPIVLLLVSLFVAPAGDDIQYVQRYDIAELMMQKYTVSLDEGDFTVFYRLSTTESEGEGTMEDLNAKVTSMDIDKERTSLVIRLDEIKQTDIMSVRFPHDLISAEDGDFLLLVDGNQKGYESSEQEGKTNMIFVIPAQTTEIEIIGTRVIPEFSSMLAVLIIVMSLASVLPLMNFLKKN